MRSNRVVTCAVVVLVGAVAVGAIALTVSWSAIAAFIQQTQNSLHRELAEAIRLAKENRGTAFWSLIGLSFLYGVFHAAGPGHGKMVIATYMVSHPADLRRGLIISSLSSLTQGVTAIAAVGAEAWLLSWTARDANAASGYLEVASYALIAGLGAYLAIAALWRIRRRWLAGPIAEHGPCIHHGHGAVSSEQSGRGLLPAAAMITSIGIRPCSGAILVLIFAFALEIVWGGILAVLAMSAGTALTVSALAVLAVCARSVAQRVSGGMSRAGIMRWTGDGIALVGGLMIVALGATLVSGAIAVQSHPLL